MARALHYLTQSPTKLSAIRAVLEPEYDVVPVDLDVPEIQANTSLEIARRQAIAAARELGVPVAREDHQTCFAALNGMPGPFAAYFQQALPIETLLELIEDRDHSGYWILAMAYAQPTGECVTFEHRIDFVLSRELRGDPRENWNRSMTIVGESQTLAEMPGVERHPAYAANYVRLKGLLDAGG